MLLGEAAVAVAMTHIGGCHGGCGTADGCRFAAIASASARLPDDERYSDLYLDDVAAGTRDVTVFFADLKGFTRFSEVNAPDVVRTMLNTYFEAVLPSVRAAGGRIDRFIGDAVMVTFNVSADQPDHVVRAARAALGFQVPRNRSRTVIPTGRVSGGGQHGLGHCGRGGGRQGARYTVLGDIVNVAAHIESFAPEGSVVISDATYRDLPGAPEPPRSAPLP